MYYNDLPYKRLGSSLGTQYISLPDNWEKLHIVIALEGSDRVTMEILKDDTSTSQHGYFQTCYYQDSAHFCRVVIQITFDNKITMNTCFYNSTTNVADQKYFVVKYR
jgi:hypothetical protein